MIATTESCWVLGIALSAEQDLRVRLLRGLLIGIKGACATWFTFIVRIHAFVILRVAHHVVVVLSLVELVSAFVSSQV
jgi:hypothetical protein